MQRFHDLVVPCCPVKVCKDIDEPQCYFGNVDWHAKHQLNDDAQSDCVSCLPVELMFEEIWILKGTVG